MPSTLLTQYPLDDLFDQLLALPALLIRERRADDHCLSEDPAIPGRFIP